MWTILLFDGLLISLFIAGLSLVVLSFKQPGKDLDSLGTRAPAPEQTSDSSGPAEPFTTRKVALMAAEGDFALPGCTWDTVALAPYAKDGNHCASSVSAAVAKSRRGAAAVASS